MNYIGMTYVCEGCGKDCKTACADGSCALANYREPPPATNDGADDHGATG